MAGQRYVSFLQSVEVSDMLCCLFLSCAMAFALALKRRLMLRPPPIAADPLAWRPFASMKENQ